MEAKNNYLQQLKQAEKTFLGYNHSRIAEKMKLQIDADYLYLTFLSKPYRLDRKNGSLYREQEGCWEEALGFGEVMTILDILCDSREDRSLSGCWCPLQAFGMQFHENLLEPKRDSFADSIQSNPDKFRRACKALGGTEEPGGDICYAIELMDGLCVCIRFWFSDDEFPAQVRWFFDENANQYLKYETMHYAAGFISECITAQL